MCSPSLGTLNHTGPSSAAIQRRGAVQKHTQSTQGLSIQIEDGSRLTARRRGVDDSSSVRTCLWGGCSKVVPRLCCKPIDPARLAALFANEGNRRAGDPSRLPRSVFVGKGSDTPTQQCSQRLRGTWPQPTRMPNWNALKRQAPISRRAKSLALQRPRSALGQASNPAL